MTSNVYHTHAGLSRAPKAGMGAAGAQEGGQQQQQQGGLMARLGGMFGYTGQAPRVAGLRRVGKRPNPAAQ